MWYPLLSSSFETVQTSEHCVNENASFTMEGSVTYEPAPALADLLLSHGKAAIQGWEDNSHCCHFVADFFLKNFHFHLSHVPLDLDINSVNPEAHVIWGPSSRITKQTRANQDCHKQHTGFIMPLFLPFFCLWSSPPLHEAVTWHDFYGEREMHNLFFLRPGWTKFSLFSFSFATLCHAHFQVCHQMLELATKFLFCVSYKNLVHFL